MPGYSGFHIQRTPTKHIFSGFEIAPDIIVEPQLFEQLGKFLWIKGMGFEGTKVIDSHGVDMAHENHRPIGTALRTPDHGQYVMSLNLIILRLLKQQILWMILEIRQLTVKFIYSPGTISFTAGLDYAGNFNQPCGKFLDIVITVQVHSYPPPLI